MIQPLDVYTHRAAQPSRPRQHFVLRPLEIKQLFDFALRVYRGNFAQMFLIMAVAEFPISLLTAFAVFKLVQLANSINAMSATGEEPGMEFLMSTLEGMLPLAAFGLLAAAYYLLALPLAYLACSKLCQQALFNRPWTIRQALDFARTRYWPTQGALFLFALPLLLVALLLLLPVLAFSQLGNDTGTIASSLFALSLIWLGLIGTWLLWFRLFPALIGAVQSLEAAPPGSLLGQAMWYLRRSFELTRGYFWRVFGLIMLFMIAIGFFQDGIRRTISTIIELAYLGSVFEQGFESAIKHMTENPSTEAAIVTLVLSSAVSLFFPALQIAYMNLLYLDLRFRKEGLDIELALGTAPIDN